MTNNYLKRYESGEFAAWDELVAAGSDVLKNPGLLAEAEAVAYALMQRVRRNIKILRSTLIALGASIGEEGVPLTTGDLAPLVDRFGPLPLSLDIFYRVVGSIYLTPNGKNPYDYGRVAFEEGHGISLVTLDPLEIESVAEFGCFLEEYDSEASVGVAEVRPFDLYLCRDFLHKQNVSGGESYLVQLPATTVQDRLDPRVLRERHELSFVNYLRYCFRWGGFPGLDVIKGNENELLSVLCKDLEQF